MYKYGRDSFCFHRLTPDSIYWLGFLYTDGSIQIGRTGKKPVVQLKLHDFDAVEAFRQFTKYEGAVETICEKKKINGVIKEYTEYQIRIRDNEMVNQLIDLGCTPQKTYNIDFPTFIPEHLMKNFILGVFDGDGSVFEIKGSAKIGIDITGCRTFLSGVHKTLQENKILGEKEHIYKTHSNSKEIARIRFGGAIQVMNFYHYIYNDLPTFYLKRKKDVFEKILSRR